MDLPQFVERINLNYKALQEHVLLELIHSINQNDLLSTSWTFLSLKHCGVENQILSDAQEYITSELEKKIENILEPNFVFSSDNLNVSYFESIFCAVSALGIDSNVDKYEEKLSYLLGVLNKYNFFNSIKLASDILFLMKINSHFLKLHSLSKKYIGASNIRKKGQENIYILTNYEKNIFCNILFGINDNHDLDSSEVSFLVKDLKNEELTKLGISLYLSNNDNHNHILSNIERYLVESFFSSGYEYNFIFRLKEYLSIFSSQPKEFLGNLSAFSRENESFDYIDNQLVIHPKSISAIPNFLPKVDSLMLYYLNISDRKNIIELNYLEKKKIVDAMIRYDDDYFSLNKSSYKVMGYAYLFINMILSVFILYEIGLSKILENLDQIIMFFFNGDYGDLMDFLLENNMIKIASYSLILFYYILLNRNIIINIIGEGTISKKVLLESFFSLPIISWLRKLELNEEK